VFQDPEYIILWQLELANKQWPIYQSLAACTYEDLMSNQSSNRNHPLLGWYTNLKLIICAWTVCNTKNSDGNKVDKCFGARIAFCFPPCRPSLLCLSMGFKTADEEISGTVHSGPQEVLLCSDHISGNQGSSILVACRFLQCQVAYSFKVSFCWWYSSTICAGAVQFAHQWHEVWTSNLDWYLNETECNLLL